MCKSNIRYIAQTQTPDKQQDVAHEQGVGDRQRRMLPHATGCGENTFIDHHL